MPLKTFKDFQKTIIPFHQATEILAPINTALREKQNNWLHLPLEPHHYGLSSGKYPNGGEVTIDFYESLVMYYRPTGGAVPFPLKLHTQASLFEALLQAMKEDTLADYFSDIENDNLIEGFLNKISNGNAEVLQKKLALYAHTDKFKVDADDAKAYGDALYEVFTGIARFRSRLNGHLTPIVVFPEHFDLSTLWFRDAEMNDHKEHINFGFAPYTPDMYDEPYFYAYIYPYPENFTEPELPEPAFWNPEGFKGIVVKYEDIAKQENPALFTEKLCRDLFDILQPLLG